MTMTGDIFLVDMDDTLLDLKTPVMHMLNDHSNKDYHWSEWDSSFIAESVYGINQDTFRELALANSIIEKAKPHDGVRDFIKSIKNSGMKVVIATARGWHPEAKNVTEEWLSRHADIKDIYEINVIDFHECKATAMNSKYKINFCIDDNEYHCSKLSKVSDNVIVFDQPWNRHLNGGNYKRVHSLHDATRMVLSLS